jgi:glutathione peroxidase
VSFPLTSKLEVNGANAHPLWKAMKEAPNGRATGLSSLLGNDIKWNFSKMLLDANGNVVGRFGSMTTPETLRADIEKLLA